MKKYLSIVLACLMVLSNVAFAAPVAVGTVETTQEVAAGAAEVFEAEVAEETGVTTDLAIETHVFGITFDNIETIANSQSVSTIATTYNIPSNFPEGATYTFAASSASFELKSDETDSTNKFVYATATSPYSRWMLTSNKVLPNGTYRIVEDLKLASSSTKSHNVNLFDVKGANYPVIGGGVVIGTEFDTFEKEFTYVNGTTGLYYDCDKPADGIKEYFATQAVGFQMYLNEVTVDWYVDNLNVYYKPESRKVTFVGRGPLPEAVDVVKNGNLVPSEFEPQFIPAGAEAFLGWSLTEGGEVLNAPIEISEDTTLYAVYKDKTLETTSKYGKLAYFVDFDVADGTVVKKIGGNGTHISNLSAYSAPALDGMPTDVRIVGYTADYTTKDGVLIITNDGQYPRFYLQAFVDGTNNLGTFPVGVYTLEWRSKTDNNSARENSPFVLGTNLSIWPTSNIGRIKNLYNNTKDVYGTFTASVAYDGNYAYNENVVKIQYAGTQNDDMSDGLARFGVYCGSGVVDSVRSYDWVKLWYTPLEINLSFDANDHDVEVPETKKVISLVKFDEYILPDCGTSRFVGWSETKNGDVITDVSRVYTEDTTLYAVWDDNYYASEEEKEAGELVISFNYNDMGIGNHHSAIWGYGTTEGSRMTEILFDAATKPDDGGPWFQKGEQYADGSYVYGIKYGTYNVVGSYKHPDNAFVIDQKIAANGGNKYPKVYLPGSAYYLKDGIYTIFVEATVKEAVNATVNYDAFANVQLEGTEKYVDKAVGTEALALDGKAYYLKKTFFVKDGYYAAYGDTAAFNKIEGNAKSQFGFNFSVYPVDKSKEASVKIECDNFKIYYKEYDYAPKSYTESSIRVANDDKSGIRFKASVSSVERSNEELTEYGFIVTRSALLEAAGVDKDNFTKDSNVVKVSGVNYSTSEGIDKIFETSGNNFFFTAIIYGVPNTQYKDKLVVRPYAVFGDSVVYGDAMENSVYDVALKLKGTSDYALYKDAIDNILAGNAIA